MALRAILIVSVALIGCARTPYWQAHYDACLAEGRPPSQCYAEMESMRQNAIGRHQWLMQMGR